MDDITKIVELLEKSGLLIDGTTETVKHKLRKQEGGFLEAMVAPMAVLLVAPMISLLIQPLVSSLINAITGKGKQDGFLPLFALLLMMKVLEKGVRRTGRGYINMERIDKNFWFPSNGVLNGETKNTAVFLSINNETKCIPLLCFSSRLITYVPSFIPGK